MIFIFGIRVLKIGRYIDTEHICFPCRSYNREILIYQRYFHFCLVPVFPVGRKYMEMLCLNCGDETNLESVSKEYIIKARTPFYLYTALILTIGLIGFWFYWKKNDQKLNESYIQQPVVGDVYTVTEVSHNGTEYNFLRVVQLRGDSVDVIPSHLQYLGFVSNLADDDYFDSSETSAYRRRDLEDMLGSGKIYSVDRNYSRKSNFNQIK